MPHTSGGGSSQYDVWLLRTPTTSKNTHLESEQRKSCTQSVPQQSIGSHRASTIHRAVDIDQVRCGGDKDGNVAPSKWNSGQDRRYPVDVTLGRPGEPEESTDIFVSKLLS